ncbi:MAG: hypothetical protein KGM15_06195 [Pseudomonadota bacterium]|nr:hypothetical protein [Pseudomonadota bacterium]
MKTAPRRAACSAVMAVAACLCGAAAAAADPDTPAFHRGACEGAYPGYLRGVVDGYNELSQRRMDAIPNPAALAAGDETLGYRAALWAGYGIGLSYGMALAKAARGDGEIPRDEMMQPGLRLNDYLAKHCGVAPAGLEPGAVPLNQTGAATAATLNEAQIAMSIAYWANQSALVAEKMARGAREAEAKGDKDLFLKFRDAARTSAQQAANFAQQARAYSRTGKEEAVPAINDAQAAAERARKAADSLGDGAPTQPTPPGPGTLDMPIPR